MGRHSMSMKIPSKAAISIGTRSSTITGAPRSQTSCWPMGCSGSTGTASTACAWMPSLPCSISITAGLKAGGFPTNMAAAKTSTPSTFCAASIPRCSYDFPTRRRQRRSRPPGPWCRGRSSGAVSDSATSGTWDGCTTRSNTSARIRSTASIITARSFSVCITPPSKPSSCRCPTTKSCTVSVRFSAACLAINGSALPICAPITGSCSVILARSSCSWAASSVRKASGGMSIRSIGIFLSTHPMPVFKLSCVISTGFPGPCRLRMGSIEDGRGTNFALFSANAEKVELCLFDSHGRREIERIALPERTEDVWHGYLSDVAPGQLYGYRVHGPYQPERGLRFNAHKLLIDPYAKQLAGRLVWSDAHFGYRAGSARGDLSFDRRDNARGMPKSMVVDEAFTWGEERRPSIPWRDTVIYEAHVKGLTPLREDAPPLWRGSYRALTAPAVVEHLKRLGVTAVELLPIHAFIDDRHLIERGLSNYWGYNTLAFFAPEARYAMDGPLDAFRSTVSRLHDAGIEVILDVVYNHTCEGNHLGPTLSFRGIDNASYYWLLPDHPRYYDDFTGCGNALNFTNPRVLQLVMDSLRYWVDVCHVDGFRFDLATTLGRGPNGFDGGVAFFAAIRQDPVLAGAKLIPQPWDLGPDCYRGGGFPLGGSEWDDRLRRTLRPYL